MTNLDNQIAGPQEEQDRLNDLDSSIVKAEQFSDAGEFHTLYGEMLFNRGEDHLSQIVVRTTYHRPSYDVIP